MISSSQIHQGIKIFSTNERPVYSLFNVFFPWGTRHRDSTCDCCFFQERIKKQDTITETLLCSRDFSWMLFLKFHCWNIWNWIVYSNFPCCFICLFIFSCRFYPQKISLRGKNRFLGSCGSPALLLWFCLYQLEFSDILHLEIRLLEVSLWTYHR